MFPLTFFTMIFYPPSLTPFILSSYLKEFGFTIPDRAIMVDDIRVRGCGISGIKSVYKTKMGSGHAKPVTVYMDSFHRITLLNILYTCAHLDIRSPLT